MNLRTMTLKQLYKRKKDVENAIQAAKSRELELAKKKLEKEAQKLGYSLSELLDSTPSKETAQRALRKSVAPKYQPPHQSRRNLDRSRTQTALGASRAQCWKIPARLGNIVNQLTPCPYSRGRRSRL